MGGRTLSRPCRTLRAAPLLVGIVVASLVFPRPGSAALAPAQIELGATNVLKGDRSGSATVIVSRDTRLASRLSLLRPSGPNRHVRLQGGGLFVGFMLTKVVGGVEQVVAAEGRFANCKDACPQGMNYVYPSESGKSWIEIPAGVYRLYFLTTGGRATVRFDLPGLKGTTRVAPTAPLRVEEVDLQPTVGGSPGGVYSAGATGTLYDTGVILGNLWFSGDVPSGASAQGDCLYYGRPSVPDPVAYSPACIPYNESGLFESGGSSLLTGAHTDAGITALNVFRGGLRKGLWSYGFWYTVTSVIEQTRASVVFVSLNGA